MAWVSPALDGLGAAGSHGQGAGVQAAGVDVIPAQDKTSNWSVCNLGAEPGRTSRAGATGG